MFKKVAEKKTKTTHPSVQILAPVTHKMFKKLAEKQRLARITTKTPGMAAKTHPLLSTVALPTVSKLHMVKLPPHPIFKLKLIPKLVQTVIKPPPPFMTLSKPSFAHKWKMPLKLIIFSQHTLEFPIQKFPYTYSHTPPSLVPHSHQNAHSHISLSFGKPKQITHSSHPLHHPFTNLLSCGPYHQLSFH